jgi:ATP/maltotriose-dependent transcriptional regulator MalT/DNA-binding SARP family transcriptional activator
MTPGYSSPDTVARPDLERRLDRALSVRVTLVTAGAGFGKSTLLRAWSRGGRASVSHAVQEGESEEGLARGLVEALRAGLPDLPDDVTTAATGPLGPDAPGTGLERAEALASSLCAALLPRLDHDLALIVDDAHLVIARAPALRLIEELCRQAPPRLHLVLLSRVELPLALGRMRARGETMEITAGELAFSDGEVASFASALLGELDPGMAGVIRETTGGWPAAVRLTLEALRRLPAKERDRDLARLRRSAEAPFAHLAREVLEQEGPGVRELLERVAPLPRFSPELCEALGIAGAATTLAELERRGLFVQPSGAEPGWLSLHPLIRDFVVERQPLAPDQRSRVLAAAADWLATHGRPDEAVRCLEEAGDTEGLARLLRERGSAILRAGAVAPVIRALELLPPPGGDRSIDTLAGEAYQMNGQWEAALACFRDATAGEAELDAQVAWRMGLIHYLRGDLDEATEAFGRARTDLGAAPDEALTLAWHATIDWLRQDLDGCRAKAARAFEIASSADDAQALAAAHTALALVAALEGDRVANERHYVSALEYAERARDTLQIVRVRTNLGSHYLEEGSYDDALSELEVALELANIAGFALFRALALHNRAEVNRRLGRFEEAVADLRAARGLYGRLGAADAYGYGLLGDVQRERGNAALARAAYEEAIVHAEAAQDLQGLVPALAGFARLLAFEDAAEAAELAERALSYGPGMSWVLALLAAAEVALARGDHERAAELASEAAEVARARRDRAGLAEALHLGARAKPDPPAAARALAAEALELWREVGSPLGQAQVELTLASLSGPPQGRALAMRAHRRLQELGARGDITRAREVLASFEPELPAPVRIEALGSFRVLREGVPMAAEEWQSRKARELLKRLVARRGRTVARENLMEGMWPEGDPAKLGNRLSVALSTIRTGLDPERRFDAAHFVRATDGMVALNLDHVAVDVEAFLEDADSALALRRHGEPEATDLLEAVEVAYTGEFLEEDLYEDWTVPLREEARAAYLEIARALAEDALAAGNPDPAIRYLLRILEKDPFDEAAHLALVSALAIARRHGEARRAYRAYTARMAEIGVEAAPFPDPGTAALSPIGPP